MICEQDGHERPCSTCENVVTFATRKANFDCWELEWTRCWNVTHEVDDGLIPLASCSRTFLLYINTLEICLRMRTFITNCEETHNTLSKLNCRSHIAQNCLVAMIRGLKQALTRIGCLQALESGPTVEEPCPAEMTDYDHVYCDTVTGASLPSKLCEEAMQLEIKYMKEMQIHTPLRAPSRERTRTHSDWDTLGHEQG